MAKRSSKKLKDDPIADLIENDTPESDEFPDGYVFFACNQRWFGTYIVEGHETRTGQRYEIGRTGTKVDVKDMEALKLLRTEVFCQRLRKLIEVTPVGEARI